MSDWKKYKLGDVVKIIKGISYSSEDYGDQNNGVFFINLKCISKGGGFSKRGIKYYKGTYNQEQLVNVGDLIIANTDLTRDGDVIGAPLFVPKIGDKDMTISMDLTKLSVNEDIILSKYLYYFLKLDKSRKYMKSISSGSTVLHLKLSDLPKYTFEIPSDLNEQEKIAKILSRIDDLIYETDEIIEKNKKFKQGMLKKLFSEGIGHTEFKEHPKLGKLPKGWEVLKLGDLASNNKGSIKIGPFGSQLSKNEMIATGIKVYGQENIYKNNFNIGNYYISEQKFNLLKSVEIFPNDIVISMMGTIGDCRVVPSGIQRGIMDSHLMRIQIKEGINKEFITYLIRESFIVKNQIIKMSQGAVMSGLNLSIMRSILLPIPSIEEQERIVNILTKLDQNIISEQEYKNSLVELKKGIMKKLLTGDIKVKV